MQVPISIPTAGPVYRTAHRRRIVQGVEREPTCTKTHKKRTAPPTGKCHPVGGATLRACRVLLVHVGVQFPHRLIDLSKPTLGLRR